jgi:hypothetical protein
VLKFYGRPEEAAFDSRVVKKASVSFMVKLA